MAFALTVPLFTQFDWDRNKCALSCPVGESETELDGAFQCAQ